MFYNQAETRSCDAKIRSMLNTHSISFYDPYRERNRNSALELKKGLPYNKIALSLIRVLSRDPVWAKFVRGVFWQALFSYTFTRQKTRSSKCQSWDGDDKKNHLCPGYVATVFFLFFRTLKKAYYRRKKQNTKSWISPPSPTPKGEGELNVGLTRLPLWNRFWKMARRLGLRI
jgi:hypothetical protein